MSSVIKYEITIFWNHSRLSSAIFVDFELNENICYHLFFSDEDSAFRSSASFTDKAFCDHLFKDHLQKLTEKGWQETLSEVGIIEFESIERFNESVSDIISQFDDRFTDEKLEQFIVQLKNSSFYRKIMNINTKDVYVEKLPTLKNASKLKTWGMWS